MAKLIDKAKLKNAAKRKNRFFSNAYPKEDKAHWGAFLGGETRGLLILFLFSFFLLLFLFRRVPFLRPRDARMGRFWTFWHAQSRSKGCFRRKQNLNIGKAVFRNLINILLWAKTTCGSHRYVDLTFTEKMKFPKHEKIEIRISTGNPNAKFCRLRDDFALFVAFPGPSVRKVDSEFAF